MWNRWTSSAILFSLAATGALAAPPVEFVNYAWLVLRDGHHALSATLPAGTDWDAAAVIAPVVPFTAPRTGLLTLVNGDVIPGEFLRATEHPAGIKITWESGRFGEYHLPIQEVAAIQLTPVREADATVVLRNGDTLDDAPDITAHGVNVNDIVVAWDRVASVRLRPTLPQHIGTRVWLRDGGAITVSSIKEHRGGFFLRTPDGRGGMYHAGEVLAITRGAFRVRPIGPPNRHDETLALSTTHLTARERGVARWERTGAEVLLIGMAQAPDDSVEWADALISVWDGSELVFSSRTRKERPAIAIGSVLTGEAQTLTLSVQPGTAGAVNGVMEISLGVIERVEPRDDQP